MLNIRPKPSLQLLQIFRYISIKINLKKNKNRQPNNNFRQKGINLLTIQLLYLKNGQQYKFRPNLRRRNRQFNPIPNPRLSPRINRRKA